MTPIRYPLLGAAALGLALAGAAAAQDATAPETPPTAAPSPAAPSPAAPSTPAPSTPAPSTEAPAPATPATDPPAAAAPAVPGPDAGTPPAPATGAAPDAPAQPDITVTDYGEWEVGCVAGTTNCEMQQVAQDAQNNPVLLVRLVKLPEGNEAPALAIFNTPLGTLLPPGLGFRIDEGQTASLPFEWCVQEGCIVRLGLRQPEVDALKRGDNVTLTVTSIAEPEAPVVLNLSLSGFTAGYDALTTPPAPPAQAAPPTPAAPAPPLAAPLAPVD